VIYRFELDGGMAWIHEPVFDRITIGRAPEMHIVIDDGKVSRHHATALWSLAGWQLRDAGSSNGIRIDGERVREGLITERSQIAIGPHSLRFTELPDGRPVPSGAVLDATEFQVPAGARLERALLEPSACGKYVELRFDFGEAEMRLQVRAVVGAILVRLARFRLRSPTGWMRIHDLGGLEVNTLGRYIREANDGYRACVARDPMGRSYLAAGLMPSALIQDPYGGDRRLAPELKNWVISPDLD